MKNLLLACAGLALVACGGADVAEPVSTAETVTTPTLDARAELARITQAQDESAKARYDHRNPVETLEFFEVEPGQTVAEALPGGGWYSKIIIPYLDAGDANGTLVGIDYAIDMWSEFGGFATPEFIEDRKSFPSDFEADAAEWQMDTDTTIRGAHYGDVPEDLQVDRVLFIRALHNFARFEDEGGYLTDAMATTFDMVRPGGLVGVVQHRAPENAPDDWADGSNGYLKQSAVIAAMEAAGFELVATSDINANPADTPTTEDQVWRLPPTLGTSADNAELRADMEAIGESDRMTLKFRKPA